jgi:hypothetical protein
MDLHTYLLLSGKRSFDEQTGRFAGWGFLEDDGNKNFNLLPACLPGNRVRFYRSNMKGTGNEEPVDIWFPS